MTNTATLRYFTSDAVLQTALDLNAIEAICRCDTYLYLDTDLGRLAHAQACNECHNPRTGDGYAEDCDRPHTCGQVTPVTCHHDRCEQQAAPHETEGICGNDLMHCCGCCQPPDYDIND